jgi:integrase
MEPKLLVRKYPKANKQWSWQYAFPAKNRSVDPRSGKIRRHHLNEQTLQRAVRNAIKVSNIDKPGSCHTLRHQFWNPLAGVRL